MATATRPKSSARTLSFRDRLSRLTYHQACKLLGDKGEEFLRSGRWQWSIDVENDVYLGGDLFRVRVPDAEAPSGRALVVMTRVTARKGELVIQCDQCETACEHAGAALSFLLDEKTLLGLAAPPDETVPLELLTEEELRQRAIEERRQRAQSEKMSLRSTDPSTPWTDYHLTSHESGKTYRVALHGEEPGSSFCSCPDFRTNHLGTCKHILFAIEKVRKRFSEKARSQPFVQKTAALCVDYSELGGLRFLIPEDADKESKRICGNGAEAVADAREAVKRLRKLERTGTDVLVYPDAEEWIERRLLHSSLEEKTAEIRSNPSGHPLRKSLLKTELLPYQMDGVAFAVGAGRAILADDMGLGKTIQGVGVAELYARLVGLERVLVVCPASLKSQWRDEVLRFSNRTVQLVTGNGNERAALYDGGAFFTICNYEQVMRDLDMIERVPWDLIILDEGQRIKNWETKTSQVIRSLKSRFALVLSGTPLENRIDDLYTIVKFVDDRRLGPAYRFFHRHRVVDDKGKVQGYRRLDELRESLRPILLRRTRAEVMPQLPERTTSIIRIRPTQEQLDIHNYHLQQVSKIVRKAYLTEMDLLQLQKSLLMCRMAANSTFLVDKEEPEYSSKLDRLTELLEGLSEQQDRKIVLFSEWRNMLNRIEPILERLEMDFVRLDGQVPQAQRPAIVKRFQEDPDCRVILMTNAGSTGLNLQSANTVINVDLPWNPAVLEQRIGRAHRMGQKNPVHVYLLVTEQTMEERLLDTLATKQDLAMAALDSESDVNEIQIGGGMEELRRRLERLLGAKPQAPIDRSLQDQVAADSEQIAAKTPETNISSAAASHETGSSAATDARSGKGERLAAAGGQLLSAAMQFLGELTAKSDAPAPDPAVVSRLRSGLAENVARDESGRPQLRLTLPDEGVLQNFAEALARLLTKA